MTAGIGTRTTLRLRLGSHDAHYAGELVDGARILALFGDVATELLIKLDGDEGLFRAYESIEFLAPVLAGDFIEATGVITKIGNSSRQIAFEARKVVANCRRADLPASAADALESPIIVARALGTCVVPKSLQRYVSPTVKALPSETSAANLPLPRPLITPFHPVIITPPPADIPRDVILSAAIVGAEITREQTPYLPITPEEIAAEAKRCVAAGAAVIHLHVRNPDGSPTQDTERFREAITAIRKECDAIIQVSTGGAVGMTIDERCGPLACRPEMATLNCGSLNFGDDVFVNTRPQIRTIAERIRTSGSVPELECYEVGHVHEALNLYRQGLLGAPLHFQFVLGVPGGIPAREDVLAFLVGLLPQETTWACAAVGKHQRPMTELAIRWGGHARVGLEDNIYLERGILAEGSSALVERAAGFARSVGREPASPEKARELLGLEVLAKSQ
jgi:3-keto-5-aminohexanoate cleavage enzyme